MLETIFDNLKMYLNLADMDNLVSKLSTNLIFASRTLFHISGNDRRKIDLEISLNPSV